MQSLTILLSLLATSTVTVAQALNEPCYGNVSYCVSGPIILRCSGTSLGPGNCDDNLNHPQFGAICIESNSTAGNAICSAVGSSASPFPTVSGGLGTPTMSSSIAASTTSSASTSTESEATTTVTETVTSCPCSGTTGTSTLGTASTASAAVVTSMATSTTAASATASPTTTKSVAPSAFTGGAGSMVRAGKDVFGLVMAAVVLMGTMMVWGGMVWLRD